MAESTGFRGRHVKNRGLLGHHSDIRSFFAYLSSSMITCAENPRSSGSPKIMPVPPIPPEQCCKDRSCAGRLGRDGFADERSLIDLDYAGSMGGETAIHGNQHPSHRSKM